MTRNILSTSYGIVAGVWIMQAIVIGDVFTWAFAALYTVAAFGYGLSNEA